MIGGTNELYHEGIKTTMKKIFREPDFGCNELGYPTWHHRYIASIIIGAVIGIVLGFLIMVIEL